MYNICNINIVTYKINTIILKTILSYFFRFMNIYSIFRNYFRNIMCTRSNWLRLLGKWLYSVKLLNMCKILNSKIWMPAKKTIMSVNIYRYFQWQLNTFCARKVIKKNMSWLFLKYHTFRNLKFGMHIFETT